MTLFDPSWSERPAQSTLVRVPIENWILRRIDERPEVRRAGRAAFVRAALLSHLESRASGEGPPSP